MTNTEGQGWAKPSALCGEMFVIPVFSFPERSQNPTKPLRFNQSSVPGIDLWSAGKSPRIRVGSRCSGIYETWVTDRPWKGEILFDVLRQHPLPRHTTPVRPA
ncbi:hypothetical protein RRG08_011485 [Elysia crispata]|uniref:Uncharacterized protein n=1 Tax=Elysia crispata TaxID=231223 RepID=A0AAE1B8E0_9GAST|nr:hypothetical protein RRG08_011485 [Elysia crispata]